MCFDTVFFPFISFYCFFTGMCKCKKIILNTWTSSLELHPQNSDSDKKLPCAPKQRVCVLPQNRKEYVICLAFIDSCHHLHMLEGIDYSFCTSTIHSGGVQSLLECAAHPRTVLSWSSWSGDGVGRGSLQCSRSDYSRPSQNHLCCKYSLASPVLLFLHLRASPSVGTFPLCWSGRLWPRSLFSAPHLYFCQHKLLTIAAQRRLYPRRGLCEVRQAVSRTCCWDGGYFHSFLPKTAT